MCNGQLVSVFSFGTVKPPHSGLCLAAITLWAGMRETYYPAHVDSAVQWSSGRQGHRFRCLRQPFVRDLHGARHRCVEAGYGNGCDGLLLGPYDDRVCLVNLALVASG